jgi:hypothetical protein
MLPRAAYVDSDALRMFADPSADPAEPCEATVALRYDNIHAVLRNYLASPLIDTVVFPYGLHGYRARLLRELLTALRGEFDFTLSPVLLDCVEGENVRRMKADGRDVARIARALENTRAVYGGAKTDFPDLVHIDNTRLTPRETAETIMRELGMS